MFKEFVDGWLVWWEIFGWEEWSVGEGSEEIGGILTGEGLSGLRVGE